MALHPGSDGRKHGNQGLAIMSRMIENERELILAMICAWVWVGGQPTPDYAKTHQTQVVAGSHGMNLSIRVVL